MTTTNERPTPSDVPADGIDIELLALDLTTCSRCQGTLANIERAIETIRPVLETTGRHVVLKKVVIESEPQARQHRFATSPTVRVNGRDIALETLESRCEDCTDLYGCDEGTSCRVWRHRGREYTEAPVGLVVEALLRETVGGGRTGAAASEYDGVPDNLRRFFERQSAREPARSCCSPEEQETCCEPTEKAACCTTTTGPGTCGCR